MSSRVGSTRPSALGALSLWALAGKGAWASPSPPHSLGILIYIDEDVHCECVALWAWGSRLGGPFCPAFWSSVCDSPSRRSRSPLAAKGLD